MAIEPINRRCPCERDREMDTGHKKRGGDKLVMGVNGWDSEDAIVAYCKAQGIAPPWEPRAAEDARRARAEQKRKRSKVTRGHVVQKEKRRARINEHGMADIPDDELDDVFE